MVLFILLLYLPYIVDAQHKKTPIFNNDEKYILTAFNKADKYMDADRYD